MEYPNLVFHPIISFIQKMNLYETKTIYYLIGSNYTLTKFRVLKIDRTEPRDLIVIDDKVEYTQAEIHDLIDKIEGHNKGQPRGGTFTKAVSAFGIVGFIRFLEGYYIVLVTKRQRVAIIGHHSIYKIKDTAMIYIPNEVKKVESPEEQRYVKMFQNIDLSSNFYFSYSYDLTHTLQMNLTSPSDFPLHAFSNPAEENESGKSKKNAKIEADHQQRVIESIKNAQTLHFGVRSTPNDRFVWNMHLLKPVLNTLHPDWILYITHGFVDQSNISVYGRSMYITLIARRSNKYAGTRFLKRGANFEGDVANEVETEQMVHDASISSFTNGSYSSFVQMRGSIPGHWGQDVSKMVPKPQIAFTLSDPYGETSGKHFNQLLKRYGSPIVILNLVKKREKKKQESALSKEYNAYVRYLNQFLPPRHVIKYVSFDMARMNKLKDENVIQSLTVIAKARILKTGIFITKTSAPIGYSINRTDSVRYQTGIIRVNCVDCLDRTNTAQFALGKCALGFQLCALGVLQVPNLEFDTDCVRMLEALYEDHGDTLALQYGGSQLVHRIKTYRKTAPWTSQGNDIMQTLSRYYSLFVPDENGPHIWETQTDYYLHHSLSMNKIKERVHPLTQWWDPEILNFLPRSYEEMTKKSIELIAVRPDEECVDGYLDYHRPNELTVLSETFSHDISHSVRDFMPNFTTNISPFAVRVRPGRRREETGSKTSMKNPSLTGQCSTSSTTSSGSSGSSDSEESCSGEEDLTAESRCSPSKDSSCSESTSFEKLFPSMKEVYGVEPEEPQKKNMLLYRRYVYIHMNSIKSRDGAGVVSGKIFQTRTMPSDNIYETELPKVPERSLEIYKNYVQTGLLGASEPPLHDKVKYEHYANEISLSRRTVQC
ncbi:UNVERIFIED_CONTAM: hypothetical protein PYX00_004440 [Menopon gallinae]|uniref:SAC domain-containing protein n=1 Tax=Menopon gallinae TaxID=328185 RepID=A0AAW2I501_9NEOP